MGLQKYRADKAGAKQLNGATPFYCQWMGGPTLALIKDCPCENDPALTPRTVYISGEPDSFTSIPAACRSKGKTIRGYVTCDDNREYVFRRYLPWLTRVASTWLTEQVRHQNAVLALLRADKAGDEVLAIYETKRARLESALARFEARKTRQTKQA